jgi:cysteine-rich repeat protein
MKNIYIISIMVFNLVLLSSCEPDIKDNFFACEQGKSDQCPDGYSCVRKSEDEYRCVLNSDQFCGNGVVDDGEECDGTDIPTDLNCGEGFTFCVNCKSQCSECGNGILERKLSDEGGYEGEECDDGSKVSGDGCSPTCMFERAYCLAEDASEFADECSAWCGDNEKNGPELCDGTDLGGGSCQNQGFYGGTLYCSNHFAGGDCISYDTSECEGFCGDGELNENEMCDGIEHKYKRSCGAVGLKQCDAYCMVNYDFCIENFYEGIEVTYQKLGTGQIWGLGSDDIYAPGYGGTIFHYDGISWSEINLNTSSALVSVWGSDATDIFVVGLLGTIFHYNGTSWSEMNSNVNVHLISVWGTDANNVYTAGLYGTILHYNGNEWSTMDSTSADIDLSSIWGSDANNIYAVGQNFDTFEGIILHYDGNTWKTVNSSPLQFLSSIWGTDASNIYTVGDLGTIVHYNGNAWETMDSSTTEDLRSVWGTDASNIYVGGDNGTFLNWNGNAWTDINNGNDNDIRSIWGSDYDLYINQDRTIFHYVNTGFKELSNIDIIGGCSMWGFDSNNIFAIESTIFPSNRIFHYDGNLWNQMTINTTAKLLSIWGSDASNVYTVGFTNTYDGSGIVFYYNGDIWSDEVFVSPKALTSVWGSDASNVYVAGYGGTMFHYDGSTWNSVTLNTTDELRSIWGSDASNIYAVGFNGTIVHYDGITWKTMDSGTTNNLYSIWGINSNNIYAGGINGVLVHYDGISWKTIDSGTNSTIDTIFAIDPNNLYIGTSTGMVLHYNGTGWGYMRPHDYSDISVILSIWVDEKNIFLGTTNNLWHMDPRALSKLEGGVCEEPVTLYCNNEKIWGDTSYGKITLDGSGNPLFDSYCSSDDNSGKENFFRLDNPVTGDITITVNPYEGNINLIVLSEDASNVGCDAGSCIEFSTQDSTNIKEVTFEGEQGKTYYIVVDSKSGENSSYSIQVDCDKL